MYPLLIAVTVFLGSYSLMRLWRGSIDFLPSAAWVFLMMIPLCVEYPLFNPATRDIQVAAVLFIASMLGAGDITAARFASASKAPNQTKRALILAYTLSAVFVISSITHLLSADRIPLFDVLNGIGNDTSQSDTRNAFLRDLGPFMAVRYLYSFSSTVIAIPAVLIFCAYKRYIAAAALLLWCIFYMVASTAKSPLALGVITLAIGSIFLVKDIYARKILRIFIMIGLTGFLALVALNLLKPYDGLLKNLPEKYAQAAPPSATHLTPNLGDYSRRDAASKNSTRPKAWCFVDYTLYRIFFTPVEVAERWYEYFHYYPVSRVEFSRLIQDSRSNTTIHPASAVGLWAFYERYPDSYTKDAYAYSAIDADAYARYNWIGVIVAGLMLFGLRLWLAIFNDRNTFTHGAFYACALTLVAYLPSSASIQAMLIPQGLAVLATILVMLHILDRMRRS